MIREEQGTCPRDPGNSDMNNKEEIPGVVTLVMLAASIAALIFGVCRGEHLIVLQKAVNICMECIGIG